jgi:hypothetical protein
VRRLFCVEAFACRPAASPRWPDAQAPHVMHTDTA